MVGQWFSRRLPLAMGVYAVVMSIGFMLAFPLVGAVVQSYGWRVAWLGIAMALSVGLAPLAWTLARRGPESLGLTVDGARLAPDCRRGAARRLDLAGGPDNWTLLGVRERGGAVWAGRLGHWPIQRIDSRRTRIRSDGLLPDPGRQRPHGLGRQLCRWMACGTVVDAASDGAVDGGAGGPGSRCCPTSRPYRR